MPTCSLQAYSHSIWTVLKRQAVLTTPFFPVSGQEINEPDIRLSQAVS